LHPVAAAPAEPEAIASALSTTGFWAVMVTAQNPAVLFWQNFNKQDDLDRHIFKRSNSNANKITARFYPSRFLFLYKINITFGVFSEDIYL
jgi:hypothetical protein